MQGKDLITYCSNRSWANLYQMSCCQLWYAKKIENEAKAIAGEDEAKYNKEIARLSKDTIHLGFTQLNYPKLSRKK